MKKANSYGDASENEKRGAGEKGEEEEGTGHARKPPGLAVAVLKSAVYKSQTRKRSRFIDSAQQLLRCVYYLSRR